MPPKTAMRSAIAVPSTRIGAQGAVLVTGVAGMVPQSETAQRFGQGTAHDGVGGLDKDRADTNAAIREDAAVIAQQLAHVKSLQHIRRDPLVIAVATVSLDLGAKTQRGQNFDAWSIVPSLTQHGDEAGK